MGDLKKENKFEDSIGEINKYEEIHGKKEIVSSIAGTNKKNKMISASVNQENYAAFTKINKSRGMSNNSVLNMLIADYVKQQNF